MMWYYWQLNQCLHDDIQFVLLLVLCNITKSRDKKTEIDVVFHEIYVNRFEKFLESNGDPARHMT